MMADAMIKARGRDMKEVIWKNPSELPVVKRGGDIKIWAENYGVLPTDILHIHRIALHNCETHGNSLETFNYFENINQHFINFEWVFKNSFYMTTRFERRSFQLAEKDIRVLSTGGLPDIGIIACVRYKGIFEIFEKESKQSLKISYKSGKFIFEGAEEIKNASGYRIIIHSPTYA